jgi:pectate lyase
MNMRMLSFSFRENHSLRESRGKCVREDKGVVCVCQNTTLHGTMNNEIYGYVDVCNKTHNVTLRDITCEMLHV